MGVFDINFALGFLAGTTAALGVIILSSMILFGKRASKLD